MDLRELRYFAVLCEELHFGRAASRLHISQPPLSQAIAQLELKVGVRLLDRTTRQVTLTAAGDVLFGHAKRLLTAVDDAVGATRRAASEKAGTLRIAVGAVVRHTVLPGVRFALEDRFPDLSVDVSDEDGNDVLARVESGAADLGILICPHEVEGLTSRPIRRERPVAVVHKDDLLAKQSSVTIAGLADRPLLVWPREQSAGSHDFVLGLFDASPPASVRTIEMFGAGWWTDMRAGGFAVIPAGAAITPDFVALPIRDAHRDFVTHVVWSVDAAPAFLPELVEAVAELAVGEAWL